MRGCERESERQQGSDPRGRSVFEKLAGEEKEVQAEITPPSGFHGTMPFNVTGFDDYGPVGGVTLLVEVP